MVGQGWNAAVVLALPSCNLSGIHNAAGIFNRTCGITYSAYRNVFPLWALAAYERRYKFKAAA